MFSHFAKTAIANSPVLTMADMMSGLCDKTRHLEIIQHNGGGELKAGFSSKSPPSHSKAISITVPFCVNQSNCSEICPHFTTRMYMDMLPKTNAEQAFQALEQQKL